MRRLQLRFDCYSTTVVQLQAAMTAVTAMAHDSVLFALYLQKRAALLHEKCNIAIANS